MEFTTKRENGVTSVKDYCSAYTLYEAIANKIEPDIYLESNDRQDDDDYTFDMILGSHEIEINSFPEEKSFQNHLNTLDTPEKVKTFLQEIKTEIENFFAEAKQDCFPETKIEI